MRYRSLKASRLKVPEWSFGAVTFGGKAPLSLALGRSGVEEVTRLADLCLEAGANLFDTADVYSDGQSEDIPRAAIKGRRDKRRDASLSLRSVPRSRWIHAAQSSPGVSESTEMHADPGPLASTFALRRDERSASQAAATAARAALQDA